VTVITATPCRHDDDRVLVDETQHSVAPVVQEITLENTLGIDLGLNNFLIDSDGHKINNPRLLKNSLKTLRVQQRTVDLVKTHHTAFVVEDLNIKGTVKNRKLARTLHNVGWGQLLLFLSYKCEQAGKTVHNIGRYEPRSKVCSCCSDKMTMSIVRSAP
jgi:putative transposase